MDSRDGKEVTLTSSVNGQMWGAREREETEMMLKVWTGLLVMLELWEWVPHVRELMSEKSHEAERVQEDCSLCLAFKMLGSTE